MKNPHEFMYDVFCHITAKGNVYQNTTGAKDNGLGGTRKETGQDFDVVPFTSTPYFYDLDSTAIIPNMVSNGSAPKTECSSIGLVPVPGQGAVNVKRSLILSWKNGTGNSALKYRVYFGTTVNPQLVATVNSQSYQTTALNYSTVYYWRVDKLSAADTIQGKLWTFKTEEEIQNVPVTGVKISPEIASVGIDLKTQLIADISPSNATNKSVTWTSDKPLIASVSSSGLVTGIAVGSATITATTGDGQKTATCTVNVTERPKLIPIIKLEFNENTGTTVTNTGSASATFTKTDIPAWSTNTPISGGKSAVNFGQTNGNYYIESNSVISQLAGLSDFTICGWVNCSSSTMGSGGNRIVSWIYNGGNGVDLVYISDGSLKLGINQWPDKSTAISSTGKITVNQDTPASNWKFIAVTYRASDGNVGFYFGDNSNVAALDKSLIYNQGVVGTTIGNLSVGHFNSQSSRTTRTDRMFKGLIDQIEIYNCVLTLSEIQSVQGIGVTGIVKKSNENRNDTEINVFPNPAAGNLYVTGNLNTTANSSIEIFNTTGGLVFSKHFGIIQNGAFSLTIPSDNIPAGFYIIRFQSGKEEKYGRFIKK